MLKFKSSKGYKGMVPQEVIMIDDDTDNSNINGFEDEEVSKISSFGTSPIVIKSAEHVKQPLHVDVQLENVDEEEVLPVKKLEFSLKDAVELTNPDEKVLTDVSISSRFFNGLKENEAVHDVVKHDVNIYSSSNNVNEVGKKKSLEKVAFKDQDIDAIILEYLRNVNRPINGKMLQDGLTGKNVKKDDVMRRLNFLVQNNVVKRNEKKIFWISQESANESEEDLGTLEKKVDAVKAELEELQNSLISKKAVLEKMTNDKLLSEATILLQIETIRRRNAQLLTETAGYLNSSSTSQEQKEDDDSTSNEIKFYNSFSKMRKENIYDVAEKMLENIPQAKNGIKTTSFLEEIGLEIDQFSRGRT